MAEPWAFWDDEKGRVQWFVLDGGHRRAVRAEAAVGHVTCGWRPELDVYERSGAARAFARVAVRRLAGLPELLLETASYIPVTTPALQITSPHGGPLAGLYLWSAPCYFDREGFRLRPEGAARWALVARDGPAQRAPVAEVVRGPSAARRFLRELLAGGLSAAVSRTAAYPFERAKLLRQQEAHLIRTGRLGPGGLPPTFVGLLLDIVRREGVLALWRGNLLGVLRYFPTQVLNFALRDAVRALLPPPRSAGAARLLGDVVAGGLAGVASLAVVYPLDHVATRLACDARPAAGGAHEYAGIVDCAVAAAPRGDPRALYRGFAASCAGLVLYRAAYFGLYDLMPRSTNPFLRLLATYAVTILAGLVTYPVDTVRRRLIVTATDADRPSGALHCAYGILVSEGPRGFYGGAVENVKRTVFSGAVLMVADAFLKPPS